MPRRREVQKRKILPDPKYQDRLVTKFVNNLMRRGKRSTAEAICYGALDLIGERTSEEPLKVFKKALENIKPIIEAAEPHPPSSAQPPCCGGLPSACSPDATRRNT